MEEDKKILLKEQAQKIEEIIQILNQEFPDEFEDEQNFLAVVKNNLYAAMSK